MVILYDYNGILIIHLVLRWSGSIWIYEPRFPIIWFSFIVPAKLTMLLKIISTYKIYFLICAGDKTHNLAVSMREEWWDRLWIHKAKNSEESYTWFGYQKQVMEAGHTIIEENIIFGERNTFFLLIVLKHSAPKSLGNSLLYRETEFSDSNDRTLTLLHIENSRVLNVCIAVLDALRKPSQQL